MVLKLSIQARREVIQHMAPRYQQVSACYKGAVLDEVVTVTGYARRSAIRLLNHPPQGARPPKRQRQARYGPEVQQALFLLWHQANRICSKRLMPFLPTLIEALQRHHHLQMSEDCRSQLLSMSAATADRLLRASRARGLGSPSTTRAGTWLKQQIPLRTFAQWNETCPGFLEADLVAHCGAEARGSFLFTLTLTDIATGWTECLPLRSKNAEEVLSAFQRARTLLPFPILGVDTDNGTEFINEQMLTYCEEEGISFTRGRPDLKNDQCCIEQKNGAVVRQVVGHERFEGEAVYQQLGEVYQALRLYVNGFQPSMKLQKKYFDGRTLRRVYDAAKTPLQRLLLSQALPASRQQELERAAHMLDPLRLFDHLHDLQQALFHITTPTSSEPILPFCLQRCLAGPDPALLDQRAPEAEQQVFSAGKEDGPTSVLSAHHAAEAHPLSSQETSQHAATCPSTPPPPSSTGTTEGQPQASLPPKRRQRARHISSEKAIEQAIQDYLQEQRNQHRRPKTLEWHEMALGSLQQYLQTEHDCVLVRQISQTQVSGWLTFLQAQPSATGALRSPGTVCSYARSARAFCHWMVQHQYLSVTPFTHLSLPQGGNGVSHQLEAEEWKRLLVACHPPKGTGERAERAAARNRAILWVLFDTGMQASELCRLRVGDVDREQGVLVVQGKGAKQRRLTLGHEGLSHVRAYLDTYRLAGTDGSRQRAARSLFFSLRRGIRLPRVGSRSCLLV